MNQHTPIPRKTATKGKTSTRKAATTTRAAARPKLDALARTAKRAGRVVSRVGAKAAEAGAQSLKQEQPQTLAKMALAALAPRIATAGLRFVMRNPLLAVAGLLVVGVIATMAEDGETATA